MKEKVARCSDPYRVRCRNEATSSMAGWRFSLNTHGIMFDDIYKVEKIMIYLCDECCYWNCDWDWDTEPDGPGLELR